MFLCIFFFVVFVFVHLFVRVRSACSVYNLCLLCVGGEPAGRVIAQLSPVAREL